MRTVVKTMRICVKHIFVSQTTFATKFNKKVIFMEDEETKQSQTFKEVQDELAEWRERIEQAAEADDRMRAPKQDTKDYIPSIFNKECLVKQIKRIFSLK